MLFLILTLYLRNNPEGPKIKMINYEDKEVREGWGQFEATCNIGKQYLQKYRCDVRGLILLVKMFDKAWDGNDMRLNRSNSRPDCIR